MPLFENFEENKVEDDAKKLASQLGEALIPTHLAKATKMLLMQTEVPSQLIYRSQSGTVWVSPLIALMLFARGFDSFDRDKVISHWYEMLEQDGEGETVKNILATLVEEAQKEAIKNLHNFVMTLNILTRKLVVMQILFAAANIAVAKRKTEVDYV